MDYCSFVAYSQLGRRSPQSAPEQTRAKQRTGSKSRLVPGIAARVVALLGRLTRPLAVGRIGSLGSTDECYEPRRCGPGREAG